VIDLKGMFPLPVYQSIVRSAVAVSSQPERFIVDGFEIENPSAVSSLIDLITPYVPLC